MRDGHTCAYHKYDGYDQKVDQQDHDDLQQDHDELDTINDNDGRILVDDKGQWLCGAFVHIGPATRTSVITVFNPFLQARLVEVVFAERFTCCGIEALKHTSGLDLIQADGTGLAARHFENSYTKGLSHRSPSIFQESARLFISIDDEST